ncbi:D-inositol 3-phosphate glycosyltransferase [Fundidesulfovibrio magnetotacticus]|uniref:D-inositol 3-phosphate glycosyltransferase n=1 Tax=Fundidesulfovibrio magnetotacticus TaxID=2730080 RepID=A0A6V8LRL9_9BACT|nr:GT4 family glycosyltransferase PelF [Fundidesulfovibrio magnetotacticus]GFK95123.1 D-inositol 3-phosphate glycosyltransferase [Fundidesulfovibrio magnetotacticus]
MSVPPADVCLLLEGTYPYVAGGVSGWVHNLIKALPDFTFSAVCILPDSTKEWPLKYDPPENFIGHDVIYLHDRTSIKRSYLMPRIRGEMDARLRAFHQSVHDRHPEQVRDLFLRLMRSTAQGRNPSVHEYIHGRAAWKLVVERYQEFAPEASFLDYFWTYRFTHLPLFKLLEYRLPEAKAYHTVCTGYAGFLGMMARLTRRRPLLLTEHGIYVKERKIEIAQAEWIYADAKRRMRLERDLGIFHKFWIRIFESLGRLTYDCCARIISLYEGNRQLEIEEGADPARTEVIPNGINLEHFQNLKPEGYPDPAQKRFKVGFVGRVVPIKDVHTFVRACKIVSMRLPGQVEFLVLGPRTEDEEYYKECLELVHMLGLEQELKFLGRVNVREYYKELDLVVLTSISEAQPLVLMEANCAGIPVVASDVGSCRELLEGRVAEDRALGHSGMVTKVANPAETAEAMVACLTDFQRRSRMIEAGRARIDRFYREDDLNERYRAIYREAADCPELTEDPWQA